MKSQKNYHRPKKTITDQLTPAEIAAKLANYVKVDDLKYVKTGSHLRYFVPDKKDASQMKFRLGGFLKYLHDDYLYLSPTPNGKDAWCVQRKGAVFYRKMFPAEAMKKQLEQLQTENARLRAENDQLKAQLAAKH